MMTDNDVFMLLYCLGLFFAFTAGFNKGGQR